MSERQRAQAEEGEAKTGAGKLSLAAMAMELELACRLGRVKKARELLAAGADPNMPEEWGQRPLVEAALAEQWACCEALIDAGGALNEPDGNGQTPLLVLGASLIVRNSVSEAGWETLRGLIARGADAAMLDGDGCSTLGLLCGVGRGNLPVARFLLENGASPEAPGVDGPSGLAVLCAKKGGAEQERIAELLISFGADPRPALEMKESSIKNKSVWRLALAEGARLEAEELSGATAKPARKATHGI